jgi:hypothetical protein
MSTKRTAPEATTRGCERETSCSFWCWGCEVDAQCTPHPLKCFLQKLTLTRARERIAKKTYIRATGYVSEPFDRAMANARVKGWRIYEVPCGHDVMLDMPERLAAVLRETV